MICLTMAVGRLLAAAAVSALVLVTVLVVPVNSRSTFVVTSDPAQVRGSAVPANFIGFSTEVGSALAMIGANGTKASFAQLLANLVNRDESAGTAAAGPVLRVGGNSADESCLKVNPGGDQDYSGCGYNISSVDFAAYLQFASVTAAQTNMSFVLDTNFGRSSNPHAQAVNQVHQATTDFPALREFISAFEIGNEVDIYYEHGKFRNASYGFDDYFVEFGQFANAFADELKSTARTPSIGPFLQAATFASDKWCMGGHAADLTKYLAEYHDLFRTLSWHKYATTTCNGHPPVTVAQLLSKHSSSGTLDDFVPVVASCEAANVPFVIGEANSASCGGQEGVSDRFAAALWSVAFMAKAAMIGVQGLYFHGGPHGPYAAIAYDNATDLTPEVRPLYYGLYAFAKFIEKGGAWVNGTTVVNQSTPADTAASGRPAGIFQTRQADPLCQRGILSGLACCTSSCGVCGGTGCDKLPGGAEACCAGTIDQSNISCTTHEAPCVLDDTFVDVVEAYSLVTPRGAEREMRTLVVAKSSNQAALGVEDGTVDVLVCPKSEASGVVRTALLYRLHAQSNATAAAGHGQIRFCNQTFDESVDGRPQGICAPEQTTTDERGCVRFDLPPFEAVIVVQTLS